MTDALIQQTYRRSMEAPIAEIAGFLQELLSRRLTAYLTGVTSGKTITRWASGEVTEIRDHEIEQRLRTSYEIAQLLLDRDSTQTVKAWFIGLNPQLGDISPAEAIHEGQLKESLAAARAFAIGG